MNKLICAVTVLAVSTAQADTIYVDANCPGGNGSELDPYCSIQTAIDNAVDTDVIVVAPGTYLETINFLGKAITLRSSDGADVTIIDGTGFFHVVQCVSGEGPDTVLDGFTITGGNANGDGFPDLFGGGMFSDLSSPTVTDCRFEGNSALIGGGMYSLNGSPSVTNCTFSANSSVGGGGLRVTYGSPTVTGCTFTANMAGFGGGMDLVETNLTVTDCTFSGNTAAFGGSGGGMSNTFSNPTVTNCTFSGNTANCDGGGMFNVQSSPTVTNCTFSGNTAGSFGGGMFNTSKSSPTVTNCILWDNSPALIFGPATVAYSDVESGFPGIGNIDADPLFVDSDNGDLRLSPGSPCIDAGNNWGVSPDTADVDDDGDVRELTPLDLDGNPRFADDPATQDTGCGVPIPFAVDMGAYEFAGTAASNPIYLGDLDADRVVGPVDFATLLADWGPCEPGCCLADLDLDGDVGITDFLLLLGNWG